MSDPNCEVVATSGQYAIVGKLPLMEWHGYRSCILKHRSVNKAVVGATLPPIFNLIANYTDKDGDPTGGAVAAGAVDCFLPCMDTGSYTGTLPTDFLESESNVQRDLHKIRFQNDIRQVVDCMCRRCSEETKIRWPAHDAVCTEAAKPSVVNKFFKLYRHRKFGSASQYLSDDVVIYISGERTKRVNGLYKGKKGYLEWVSTANASFKDKFILYDIEGLTEDGNGVVSTYSSKRNYTDGARYKVITNQTFWVRNSKIYSIFWETHLLQQAKSQPHESYYSTYFYYYYDGLREDERLKNLVVKFQKLYAEGSVHAMLEKLTDDFEMQIKNSPDHYLRDRVWKTIPKFVLYLAYAKEHMYAEHHRKNVWLKVYPEFLAVGLGYNAIHAYKNGSKYNVTVAQTFYFDSDNMIKKIVEDTISITEISKDDRDFDYSEYNYHYKPKERFEPVDAVAVVDKIYNALRNRDTDKLPNMIAETATMNIRSNSSLINGEYQGRKGFVQYLKNRESAFTEKNAKYTVIGLLTTQKGWQKVRGQISAERTYRDGSVYAVTIKQTFFVGRTSLIQRLNSNVTSIEKLASGKKFAHCLRNCIQDAYPGKQEVLPARFGLGLAAELNEMSNDYSLHKYTDCLCKNCGSYREMQEWSARQKMCEIAAKPPSAFHSI